MDDLPLFFEMIRSLSRWGGRDVHLVKVHLRILLLEDLDGHRRTLGRRSQRDACLDSEVKMKRLRGFRI